MNSNPSTNRNRSSKGGKTMRTGNTTAVLAAAILALATGAARAQVDQLYTTAANANWTTPATWTSAGGDSPSYPVSGDTVSWGSHLITVSTPEVFSGGTQSVARNPWLALNSTLTMDSGTFTFSAASGTHIANGNNGLWINQGTFVNASPATFYWRGTSSASMVFQNEDTYTFSAGGNFLMDQGLPVFRNDGLLQAASGNGSVTGHIGVLTNSTTGTIRADAGTLTITSGFTDGGGTIEAVNNGIVRFHTTSTTPGGGLIVTSPNTTFQTSGGGVIQLGGDIGQIQGAITAGSDVQLAVGFEASQPLAYIDFGNTTVNWTSGARFYAFGGNVLEFRSPINFTSTSPAIANDNAGADGTLRNVSGNTFTHSSTQYLLMRNNFTLQNEGTITMTSSGGLQFDNATAAIDNTATGIIQATAGTPQIIGGLGGLTNAGTIRADGATLTVTATVQDTGGTIEAITGGVLRFNNSQSNSNTGSKTTAAGTTFATSAGGAIQLGGGISQLEGSVTPGSDVALAWAFRAGQALSYVDLGSYTLPWNSINARYDGFGTDEFEFRSPVELSAAPILNANAGATGGILRNAAGNTFTASPNGQWEMRNGATFDNDGLFVHAANIINLSTNSTFQNDGTYRATGSGRRIAGTAGNVFINTGTVEVDATGGAATFQVDSGISVPQWDGAGTLTGGTWKLLASGANNATLNLDPANAGITTIGSGATVVLGGTGAGVASFAELGPTSPGTLTVQGTFLVNGTMNYSSANVTGIAVNGGTIGGSGKISETVTVTGGTVAPGASPGSLELGDALSLDGASTVEIEIGGTTFTLNGTEDYDRIKVSGTTTLGGSLNVSMWGQFEPADGDLFGIIDAVGGLTGTFAGLAEGAEVWNNGAKMYLYITYLGLIDDTTVALTGGTDVVLYALQIPEPASLALLAVGGLLCLRRRRG